MADQVKITLPDGSQREYDTGTTPAAIASSIGKRLAKDAIAAKVDGDWVDLDRPIDHDAGVSARHPEFLASKATIRLRPEDAAGLGDDELRGFLRATLNTGD